MGIEVTYVDGWKTERNTASNVAGIVTEGWATLLNPIQAHVRKLSGQEVNNLSRRANEATHRIYTNTGQDITDLDRFVGPDGKIYRILDIDNKHDLNHHVQIDCMRMIDEREQES